MARGRSRSRSRGGSSSFGTSRILVVILLGAFVVGLMVMPTASFSLAALDRGSSVDVVQDQQGVIGLDVANNVNRNVPKARLVTVTNNLGADNVQFTIDLLSHGSSDFYLGDDNAHQGSVMFTLDADGRQPVKIDVTGQGSVLTFKITATTPNSGLTATLERDVNVVGGRIDLDIVVKPDEDDDKGPKPINVNSRGVTPVAILNTSQYDVRQLDIDTLRFGPPSVVEGGGGALPSHNGHFEDVNDDGRLDLVLHYPTQKTGFQDGDSTARVLGQTLSGTEAAGDDTVNAFARGDGGDDGDDDGDDSGDDEGKGKGDGDEDEDEDEDDDVGEDKEGENGDDEDEDDDN